MSPTFNDVLKARRTIAPHLLRTPLVAYHGLNSLLDTETFVKHENHQPVGAFKVRGGINLVANLSPAERQAGVITASSGNHGQSIAYAARLFGVPATIFLPEGANPAKAAAIAAMGAKVVYHGRDFDDARVRAEEHAAKSGARFISSGDETLLIAGVATYSLEILEDLPDAGTIIVPIGGGSGAAGACIVAKTVNPNVRVIGVQAEQAPAAYLSWKAGKRVESQMETFAEGLATRAPFDLPQQILREHLDDFLLVSEAELRQAMRLMIAHTRNLAEAAGAASLAAALRLKTKLHNQKVVLVLSGGNVTLEGLRAVLMEAGA